MLTTFVSGVRRELTNLVKEVETKACSRCFPLSELPSEADSSASRTHSSSTIFASLFNQGSSDNEIDSLFASFAFRVSF